MKTTFFLLLLLCPIFAISQSQVVRYPSHEIGVDVIGLLNTRYGIFYERTSNENHSWYGYLAYITDEIGFSVQDPMATSLFFVEAIQF